jgi:hypothetical protein
MNSMQGLGVASAISDAVLGAESEILTQDSVPAPLTRKPAGYGLPCAKCKKYYSADLTACPICHSTERVSPLATSSEVIPAAGSESVALSGDEEALEAERERFLREFKSQVYSSHTQMNAAASFYCGKQENHQSGFEPAAICESCYNQLQQQSDLMLAALHLDLEQATQIVYEAVWSDPSDSGKTYQNAAQALLTELRRRAGMPTVLGPLQPLAH